jgi:HK97 family phage prohead protease
MYAAWGGDEMLRWAERTIEQMEENKNERHIKSVVETDDEIVITFGKGEMGDDVEMESKSEERAEPNELAVGDFVRWSSSGGNAYGRIIQVETDGEVEADSGFVVKGTADDPAALIRLYRYDSESDAYVERKPVLNVAHRFSTLEKFDAEVRKSSVVKEQREFRMENAEYEGNTIRGYAAVYNSDSEWMGGFYEQIEAGAFDSVLENDVRAYFNHDENLLLGRVSSGTLRIGTDKRGLFYEVDLPNTSYANDLVELMKRGDVNQSSFAFLIEKDRWEQRDGITYRIIEKVSRLLDVSPVAQPAYPDATSELKTRDLETETKEEVEAAAAENTASDSVETKEEDSNIYLYKSKILNF